MTEIIIKSREGGRPPPNVIWETGVTRLDSKLHVSTNTNLFLKWCQVSGGDPGMRPESVEAWSQIHTGLKHGVNEILGGVGDPFRNLVVSVLNKTRVLVSKLIK